MQVVEKTYSGYSLINLESWLLSENRVIFIDDNINSESAELFKRQMMYLLSKSETEPIEIQINSNGGCVDDGMMIYDIINDCPAPVYMICTGRAYSMAAVILACAQPGRRFILPNSKTMLHEVLTGGGVGGSCSTVKAISDMLVETKEKIDKLLSKHTGRKLADVQQLTSDDHYFSAKESVETGLCDRVVDLNTFHQKIREHKV